MTSYLQFYGGWAGVLIIGAGYWYLTKGRRSNRQVRSSFQKSANKPVDVRKEAKAKKPRNEGGQSSGDQAPISQDQSQKKKKKQKFTNPDAESLAAAIPNIPIDDGPEDDDIDNREFARQLQQAKEGKLQPARSQTESRQKSLKQSKANDESKYGSQPNGVETSSNNASGPSSTTGVDADDDLSAANSPEIGATQVKNLGSGDISDMLEAPTPGPSILRITEPTSPLPQTVKRSTPSPQKMETKKQRQHRQKAEARKAAKAEDEKERQVLMEKQRRTAREAEGRPAKDGSAFMAANPPKTSAWTAPKASEESDTSSTKASTNVNLLDTFDSAAKPSAVNTNAATSNDANNNGDWHKSLPSEEEQIRLIEQETAWNTVTSKKNKRATKGNAKDKPLTLDATSTRAAPKSTVTEKPGSTSQAKDKVVSSNNNTPVVGSSTSTAQTQPTSGQPEAATGAKQVKDWSETGLGGRGTNLWDLDVNEPWEPKESAKISTQDAEWEV